MRLSLEAVRLPSRMCFKLSSRFIIKCYQITRVIAFERELRLMKPFSYFFAAADAMNISGAS